MSRNKLIIVSSFATALAIGIVYSASLSAEETKDPEQRFKLEQKEKFDRDHDRDHHGFHCIDGDHKKGDHDHDHDHDHDCHKPASP